MLHRTARMAATRGRTARFYRSAAPTLAKILASDSIEKICGDTFKKRGHELVEMPGIKKDELLKIIGDYEGLVVRSGTKVTKEILDAGTKLKIVGRAGTGVDNIDCSAASTKGILVVNVRLSALTSLNYMHPSSMLIHHPIHRRPTLPQQSSITDPRW